jgi:hypothetical protein
MIKLNEDRIIDSMNIHRDLIVPFLTDSNPNSPLTPSAIKKTRADASSSAIEIMDMALCERYECKKCK